MSSMRNGYCMQHRLDLARYALNLRSRSSVRSSQDNGSPTDAQADTRLLSSPPSMFAMYARILIHSPLIESALMGRVAGLCSSAIASQSTRKTSTLRCAEQRDGRQCWARHTAKRSRWQGHLADQTGYRLTSPTGTPSCPSCASSNSIRRADDRWCYGLAARPSPLTFCLVNCFLTLQEVEAGNCNRHSRNGL